MSGSQRILAARAALASAALAFNPHQRRDSKGRWVKLADHEKKPRKPRSTKNSPPPGRPAATAPLAQRQAALSRAATGGVASRSPLGNGLMGEVARVEFNDGTPGVYKRAKWGTAAARGPHRYHQAEDQNLAEELTTLVGDALGVQVPAVHPVSETESYIELMPGQTGFAKYWGGDMGKKGVVLPSELVDSPQAKRLGLLDVLTDNGDRNTGNWLVDDDGVLYGIDHGMAFASRHNNTETTGIRNNQFVSGFLTKDGKFKAKNPLTQGDIGRLRERLEALRPTFAERDRERWLDEALGRLDTLASGASGTVDLVP